MRRSQKRTVEAFESCPVFGVPRSVCPDTDLHIKARVTFRLRTAGGR